MEIAVGSFQGLWTDPVTGLAYARARWYDARNASWLSEDPLLDVDSPNLYAFVQWQPNMGRDPLGLCGPQCANTYRVAHMSPEERNELTMELINLPFAAPRRVTELESTRQAETGSVYAAAALDVAAQGMPETGQGFVAEAALAVATEGSAPVVGKIVGWVGRKVARLGKGVGRAAEELLEAYRLTPEAGSIPGPDLAGRRVSRQMEATRQLYDDPAGMINETTPYRAGVSRRPRHHPLPQERRRFFEERGFVGDLDIDRFTIELEESVHQAIHGGGDWRLGREWGEEWNKAIMERLLQAEAELQRQMSVDEILEELQVFMKRYGVEGDFLDYQR